MNHNLWGKVKKKIPQNKYMNNTYFLETILFILEIAGIYLVCYVISKVIFSSVKYKGEKKFYLEMLGANIICFLFFLIYGYLENSFYVRVRFLQPLAFLALPISTIFTLFFAVLFVTTKKKTSTENINTAESISGKPGKH
jgi:hypothetical protein